MWVRLGWVEFFFDPPWWVGSKNPLNPTQPEPCTPLLITKIPKTIIKDSLFFFFFGWKKHAVLYLISNNKLYWLGKIWSNPTGPYWTRSYLFFIKRAWRYLPWIGRYIIFKKKRHIIFQHFVILLLSSIFRWP